VIVFGNPITFSPTNTSTFFVNGIDSRTSGIDLVGYKKSNSWIWKNGL
jgi:iron complex outermembrane receptor protein